MSATLTRDDVERIVAEARGQGKRPDLSDSNLTGLDLSGINLAWANLTGAILAGAILADTILTRANLAGANLTRANLTETVWDGLCLDGLHRYRCLLVPEPGRWVARIGCWAGTVPELRALISGDDWPESTGETITYYRPLLTAFADLCNAHIAGRPGVVEALADRWGAAA